MSKHETDILVIGAGIVGIATAYYLKLLSPDSSVSIVEQGQPMAFTSAQSGENYRNWWPHPIMKAFTDHSIDLMEEIAKESEDRINLTRRGYLLATREEDIDDLIKELITGYGAEASSNIRYHSKATSSSYEHPESEAWRTAPDGVDILQNRELIQHHFPSLDKDIKNIIHIRRGGTVSSQQLGQYMLDRFRATGGTRIHADVKNIQKTDRFEVILDGKVGTVSAGQIVNAAGPFVSELCEMVGTSLPVNNFLHQKIAFPDLHRAIPRKLPFSIDLDPQYIDWTDEEKALLNEDPALEWITKQMPGAIHCRPEGGDNGNWVKLGWAFNDAASSPTFEPSFNDHFPEIVLRGAARLHPALKSYYGHLPRGMTLYGGYYTMTEENWPLIGPTEVEGFYINGAMSGFGTMAACAGGKLCAQWVLDKYKPAYADQLSPTRYEDAAFIETLRSQNKGVL